MLQRFLDPATLASIASLKRLVNHFQDPRRAPVTSAPSARQPDEGSKAGTTYESLKTPRLGASALNVEFAHDPITRCSEAPPRAPVTSASSARQPGEGSNAGTTNESLKTPRLGASA